MKASFWLAVFISFQITTENSTPINSKAYPYGILEGKVKTIKTSYLEDFGGYRFEEFDEVGNRILYREPIPNDLFEIGIDNVNQEYVYHYDSLNNMKQIEVFTIGSSSVSEMEDIRWLESLHILRNGVNNSTQKEEVFDSKGQLLFFYCNSFLSDTVIKRFIPVSEKVLTSPSTVFDITYNLDEFHDSIVQVDSLSGYLGHEILKYNNESQVIYSKSVSLNSVDEEWYNDGGFLIESKRITMFENRDDWFFWSQFEIDKKGNIQSIIDLQKDGEVLNEINYQYVKDNYGNWLELYKVQNGSDTTMSIYREIEYYN